MGLEPWYKEAMASLPHILTCQQDMNISLSLNMHHEKTNKLLVKRWTPLRHRISRPPKTKDTERWGELRFLAS